VIRPPTPPCTHPQIELISQQLQTLKSHITQIAGLHNTILTSSTNEAKQEAAQRELDSLGSNTSRLTNDIKIRIKNMNDLNDRTPLIAGREGEKNTRRMQVAVQKKKCVRTPRTALVQGWAMAHCFPLRSHQIHGPHPGVSRDRGQEPGEV